MDKTYYSVADINFEIKNLKDSAIMREFKIEKNDNVDIRCCVNCAQNILDEENLNKIYANKMFSEYEDEEYIYRIFYIYVHDKRSQLILQQNKNDVFHCEIITDKLFNGEYFKYFDFLNHLAFEKILMQFNGFILHSCFVSCHDKGILFSAPSGTGKSTQGNLWEIYKDAEVINGDRTVIRKVNDKFMAYGSPMAGSSNIRKNKSNEVSAIVILRQAKENTISILSGKEAFLYIYQESLIDVWNQEFVNNIVDLIYNLVSEIPVYMLSCRPDREAVEVVYNKVFGTNEL